MALNLKQSWSALREHLNDYGEHVVKDTLIHLKLAEFNIFGRSKFTDVLYQKFLIAQGYPATAFEARLEI